MQVLFFFSLRFQGHALFCFNFVLFCAVLFEVLLFLGVKHVKKKKKDFKRNIFNSLIGPSVETKNWSQGIA